MAVAATVALAAAVAVATVEAPDPTACLFCGLSQSSILSLFYYCLLRLCCCLSEYYVIKRKCLFYLQ